MRYANRAKNIKNRARINEDPKDALLRQFQIEIEQLRQQLEDNVIEVSGSDGESDDSQDNEVHKKRTSKNLNKMLTVEELDDVEKVDKSEKEFPSLQDNDVIELKRTQYVFK